MVKSRMGTKSVILHSLSCELLHGYLDYGQRVLNVLKKRIGVVLILVIALCIYANKHREEKRINQLNHSLVEGDVKSPAVYCLFV